MDEGETVSKLDRKELRKQKLMEYLAAKGKLKPLNPKPYLRDFAHVSTTSVVTVNMNTGKENQGPNAVKVKKEGGKIQPLSVKAASQASGVLRRGTAQKTTRTNNNKPEPDKTLCPQTVTVATLTARIDALKSIAQSAGPRRLANQKQALTEKITTAAQAAGQPRVQFNQSAAVLAQPSHNQAPAKAESRKTHPTMSVRMSIGTVAKTKTGLIPSVTPQSSVSVLNASTRTRVPSRGHTDSSPPASVSQEASLRLRKALPIRTVSQSQVTWGTESRSLIARPPQLRGQRPSVTASRNAQQTTVRSNPAPRRPGVKVQPNPASGRPGVKVQPNPAPGRPGVKVQSNPAPRKPGVKVQPNPAPGRPGVKVQSNPAPRKPGVKVQPNPAPGRPGVKVQPNPAPGRPGVKVQPNPAPGRPGVKVLETYSKPPIRPAQKTKRILPLGALKPAQPASTGTSNQWQVKALSRAMQAAVAERVQKDSVPLADGQDMGSDNISSKLIPCKRTTAAGARELAVPQTVPRAARPASQGRWAGCVKTQVGQGTAVPQTEGKKYMTAAQEERMRKLQEWREARGISYKRPPMPVKPRVRCPAGPSQPYWASIEQEEETQALVHAVDRSLDDCIALLLEGCPVSQVQGVLSRLPAVAQKFAKFWICQARLMEREGNLDVLPMFEEAVRVVLEPVDELRAVVFDILRKKDNIQDHTPERGVEDARAPGQGLSPSESPMEPISLPKPVGALIHGDQGCSSVVKYKITATPGGFRSQQREPVRVDGHELRFFTPVRRSVRIERSSRRYPAALQDHDLCVTSYQELVGRGEMGGDGEGGEVEGCSPQMNPTVYVYRENDALRGQVHMQLVYDD